MKKLFIGSVGMLFIGLAAAENVAGVDKMLCATAQAHICFETGECYAATPWELSVPDFVVIDLTKGAISTTRASGLNRSTGFSKLDRTEGLVYLQGIEDGRAFSITIHEETGRLTAAISRDGMAVTVFGACTDWK